MPSLDRDDTLALDRLREGGESGEIAEIVDRIHDDDGPAQVSDLKLSVARRHRWSRIPGNVEIIKRLNLVEPAISRLRLKPVRAISGVHVVAVMTRPSECPHGRCAYCPTYPNVPQSYTGHEPSSMRGLQHGFDPYQQVKHRLSQLREIGHRPSKIELIIQGGTFPATPSRYQRHFVRRCLDAISGSRSSTLDEAKRRADSGATRNVGITVETRPDMCGPKEVDLMLSYGATRVEIGVQTLYDDIYEINERGHTVQDVVNAFQTAKDAGLKVVAHMMPGLPGSDFKRDLEAFRTLFEDERFKPDMIKIYPCLILVGSKIYDWWLRGLYTPYGVDEAVELIAEVKKMIPPWIRIMRVQRDIPARMIVAGVKKSNLRQLVQEKLLREGYRCRCIRCREIGHLEYKENVKIDPEELVLKSIEYGASGGREYFISIEDDRREALIGYARLRIPSERAHRREIKGGSAALVRELHVLGPSTPIGEKDEAAYQHKGFGKRLLKEAERVACVEEGCVKIVVTSGLGVKEYYRRQGYSDDGPYMSKIVNANDY